MPDILESMTINVSDVVAYARINGGFEQDLRAVIERTSAAGAAREAGLDVSESELQRVFDVWRIARGLNKAADTGPWLEARQLTIEDVERFLETNILIAKLKDKLVAEADMSRFLQHPKVEEAVREVVYSEWLNGVLG
jgi:hypothetical protein